MIGSNGALFSWCKTSERFQEGTPLLPLGLSLWKLSRRRARFLSLLMLKGEFDNLGDLVKLVLTGKGECSPPLTFVLPRVQPSKAS